MDSWLRDGKSGYSKKVGRVKAQNKKREVTPEKAQVRDENKRLVALERMQDRGVVSPRNQFHFRSSIFICILGGRGVPALRDPR